jgi:hypothetical protein
MVQPFRIAYFYCSRDTAEPERGDPNCIFRTILNQLCSFKAVITEPVLKVFRERKEQAKEDRSDPAKLTIDECVEYIIQLSEDESATILIIDALDEPKDRYPLLSALEKIYSSATPIKVLLSSRDYRDFVEWREAYSVPSISANDNREEIKHFINLNVANAIKERRLLYGKVSNMLKNTIITRLTEKAEKM